MKKILLVITLVVFSLKSQEVTFSSLYQDILRHIILLNDYEYESEGKKTFNKFVNFIFSSSQSNKSDKNIKKFKEAIKRFIKLSLVNKSFRKCIYNKYFIGCFLKQCVQRYGLSTLEQLLQEAIINKNLKLVKFLLNSNDLNINNLIVDKMHILETAIDIREENINQFNLNSSLKFKIIKTLLGKVSCIQNRYSFYILLAACHLEGPISLEIVKLLIKARTNINSQNRHGNTVLMECVDSNKVNIIKALLLAGADPNIKNNYENTPIMLAAFRGNKIIVKMLIKYKANINLLNSKGQNLLQIASKVSDNTSLIKFFLKRLGNINFQDSTWGDTPLITSILSFTDYKTIKFLLKSGADPNIKNKDNETAFIVAINNRYFDLIKLLLKYGATIDLDDQLYNPFIWMELSEYFK